MTSPLVELRALSRVRVCALTIIVHEKNGKVNRISQLSLPPFAFFLKIPSKKGDARSRANKNTPKKPEIEKNARCPHPPKRRADSMNDEKKRILSLPL